MSEKVNAFIEERDGNQRTVMEFLHEHFIELGLQPKYRFKIPFYYQKTWVCYMNPIKNDGIELVYVRARELANTSGILDFKNRKMAAGISIYSVAEIPLELITDVTYEAMVLDAEVPYTFKKKKGK